ncbi:hypothetical protein EXIGLDRAFT_837849 [Exidia glandulosa HHB12029]|uniref:Uncharacterized protein n=1 Tax=Exidia glandulosa HHB12029 TaxID=1314781 RepID=A0A166ABH4_EXIGL|nr:hypothetical protein EXIGLDRAFT_837849 [Exidia glandulosa HHB12029]
MSRFVLLHPSMRCLTLIRFLLLVPGPAFSAWTNITSSSGRWILVAPAQHTDRRDVPACGAVIEVLSSLSKRTFVEHPPIQLNFRGTSARLFGATLAHGPMYKIDADTRIFGDDEASHQAPACQQLAEWDNLDPNTQHTLAVEVPFGSVLISALMINDLDGGDGSDTTIDPAPRPPATFVPTGITSAPPPNETLAVPSIRTTATDTDTRVPESNDPSSNTSIAPPSGPSSSNTSAPEDAACPVSGTSALPKSRLTRVRLHSKFNSSLALLNSNMFSRISDFFAGTSPSTSSSIDLEGMTGQSQTEAYNATPVLSQDEMRARMDYERRRADKARRARHGHAGREQKW